MTTLATLTADSTVATSMLAKLFAPDSPFGPPLKDESGAIFIDQDPEVFRYVLQYLRNGCRLADGTPESLKHRISLVAEYYGLILASRNGGFHRIGLSGDSTNLI